MAVPLNLKCGTYIENTGSETALSHDWNGVYVPPGSDYIKDQLGE
jgi:hypothetical protein